MGGSPIVECVSTVYSSLQHTTSRIGPLLLAPRDIAAESSNTVDKKSIDHPHIDLMSDDCSLNSVDCPGRCLDNVENTDITQTKHVAFGVIFTRRFEVILGDHPNCSHGCPITLGWTFSQCPSVSIDEYEASRPPRRRRENLRTTWDERRNMLSESEQEIRRTDRQLARERNCQRKVNRRACAAFFNRENLPEDDCQSTLPAVPEAECT